MRKIFKFLLYFLGISFPIIIIIILLNFKQEKDLFVLSMKVIENYLSYIPVVAAISLLWGLILKTKDFQNSVTGVGLGFSIIMFIFIILGIEFFLQDIVLQKLSLRQTNFIKFDFLKKENTKKTVPNTTLTQKEINSFKKLPKKENIAFMMGDVFAYFKKIYKGEYYYLEDITFIGYSKKGSVDYIVSAQYAKIVDNYIYPIGTTFVDFSKTSRNVFEVHPSKKIYLTYDPEAIYLFASDEEIDKISLIDVFRFSDFLFSSKIHYLRLGNIIYNHLVYYIITFFLIFVSSIIGTKYPLNRPISKEYFEWGCFIIVSATAIIVSYDILVALARMLYELLI